MAKIKPYLIFIFCLVSFKQINAQSYIPMINDSLFWDVAYAVNDPHPCAGFGVGGPDRYAIGNDTLISGIIYKQIVGYNFILTSPSGCPPFFVDTVLQTFDFYIREDTVTQKVYRYNTTSQLDELLFDYSLQQSDSIYLPGSTNIYFYVDTLYTVVTPDGISRRYFESYPRPNLGTTGGYYIEGLGGAMGPFERPYHLFEEGYWVLCISTINGNPIWPAMVSCYNFATNLVEQEVITDEISIYPSPSSESIFMRNVLPNSIYTIYNITGDKFGPNKIEQGGIVNISMLKSGMYFIKIESDNKISVVKFIKQ